MRLPILAALIAAAPVSPQATTALDGPTILDRTTAAAGGERWAKARTLYLAGSAVFYGPEGASPRSVADDYRMWRIYDPARVAAHAAEGKVRITARSHGRLLFTVGYDGETSWNERGIIPKAEADAFWASNFGFGIIRHARDPGFSAVRVADDTVRLTDPTGAVTLFGIDRGSYAIRRMSFATPRGWHERIYDDFVRLKPSGWLQARSVTLYYNGIKQNTVRWRDAVVDGPIDDALFRPGS